MTDPKYVYVNLFYKMISIKLYLISLHFFSAEQGRGSGLPSAEEELL